MGQFETEVTFRSANTTYISVAFIDSTHFVVAYAKGAPGNGAARIGTVSGNVVTYGAEVEFAATSVQYTSVSVLDSTHFVVAYRKTTDSNRGFAIIGNVSGTTITYGTENRLNDGSTDYISVSSLDSTHFVVVYRDGGNLNRGTAIVGSVSGDAISYGSEKVYNDDSSTYNSVSALDDTHFVVVYSDVANSSNGTAIVGVVSGTTISSYGSESVFNSANTIYTAVSVLSSTHFVVAYRDNGDSGRGKLIVGVVSGTTISSYGSEYEFENGSTGWISIDTYGTSKAVVCYRDVSNSNQGTAVRFTVSGTTISFHGWTIFNSVNTTYTSCAMMNISNYIVTYNDTGGSGHGCSRMWYDGFSGTVIGVYIPGKVIDVNGVDIATVIGA